MIIIKYDHISIRVSLNDFECPKMRNKHAFSPDVYYAFWET